MPTAAFTFVHENRIIELAARNKLPAISAMPSYARKGGLISYSIQFETQFRQATIYADGILDGANAGELPIPMARFQARSKT